MRDVYRAPVQLLSAPTTLCDNASPAGSTGGVAVPAPLMHVPRPPPVPPSSSPHSLGLRSLRSESLRLYREVLRTAKHFDWPHPSGRSWGEVLAASARSEFEAARHERDPEVVTRLLLSGRDALMEAQNRFYDKQREMRDAAAGRRGNDSASGDSGRDGGSASGRQR